MSDEHPIIEDPALGTFIRATTELTDGTVLTHDWYAGTLTVDGTEIELMLEGASADEATVLLPRLREVVADLATIHRVVSDAVVTAFSQGEPAPHELDDAASDLELDAMEATSEGTVVFHLNDSCGTHFPEGYWPAAHLDAHGNVSHVTVES